MHAFPLQSDFVVITPKCLQGKGGSNTVGENSSKAGNEMCQQNVGCSPPLPGPAEPEELLLFRCKEKEGKKSGGKTTFLPELIKRPFQVMGDMRKLENFSLSNS